MQKFQIGDRVRFSFSVHPQHSNIEGEGTIAWVAGDFDGPFSYLVVPDDDAELLLYPSEIFPLD
jgi:hypothetical protein